MSRHEHNPPAKDQAVATSHDDAPQTPTKGEGATPDRRAFLSGLTGLAAGAGAAAILGAQANTAETKSKILSRIQEELDGEYLDDPLQFHKGNGYAEYTKI